MLLMLLMFWLWFLRLWLGLRTHGKSAQIVNTQILSWNCPFLREITPLARLGTSHMVLWSCGFRKGWARKGSRAIALSWLGFEILRPWAPKLTWAGCSCPQVVLEHQATPPRYQWLQLRFQHHLSLYLHFLFFQARSTRQQTHFQVTPRPQVWQCFDQNGLLEVLIWEIPAPQGSAAAASSQLVFDGSDFADWERPRSSCCGA